MCHRGGRGCGGDGGLCTGVCDGVGIEVFVHILFSRYRPDVLGEEIDQTSFEFFQHRFCQYVTVNGTL